MNTSRKEFAVAIVFLAVLMLVTFWKSFDPDLALFTSDDPLGQMHYWKSTLPLAWLANWAPDSLVGFGGGQALFNPSWVLLWLLPVDAFANWIYAVDTLGAGMFFFLFLRKKQCSVAAALFGAIVFSYCSNNFSLVYSGHIGKFGNYIYFAATLWALENALGKPRAWSWWVAASAFLGLTVAEQPDLAILFVLLFVSYLGFRIFNQEGSTRENFLLQFVGRLVLCGLISGLVAANVVISQYKVQVQGITQVSKDEDRDQAWDWATQWSFPPEETLALIAPGFFGWLNEDPDAPEHRGPYWGRTGRSANYELTHQGMSRFALSTTYIGIVPIFLAVGMAVFAFRKRYRDALEPSLRRELIFWAVIGIVTLLLAYGKDFPLYRLFYVLPKMNIIRNPNKFLHLFSIAVAVLSAYGVHHLVQKRNESLDTRLFWKTLAGLGGAALIGAIYLFASTDSLLLKFEPEFKKGSAVIVSTMTNSLLRLAVSCGILAVLWYWLTRLAAAAPKLKAAVPCAILLLATTDLYLTNCGFPFTKNPHYVEYYNYKAWYAENDLIRFLKSDPEPHRIQLLTRAGFYNTWLTIYFPYWRIQTLDITQMPRMPVDYQQYLSTLQPNILRYWQLTNCKYLVGPFSAWQQIQSDPLLKSYFELAYAFNIALSHGAVVTSPATGNATPNTQVVIRYNQTLPRVKFYDRWQVISDDTRCLRMLNSKEFNPQSEIIVSDFMAAQTNAMPTAASAKVEWLHQTDNVSEFRVTTDRRGVLLFNEKYDPSFVVTVDAKPAPLLRCNFIMKGVQLEPGTHEVRFEYRPPRYGLYLSIAGWTGCLLSIPALRLLENRGTKRQRK